MIMGTTLTATTSTAASPCASSSASTTALQRTRFFPGQLIGPDDLTQDQIYFREKLRRHNRMLHGWGVVCGVGVIQGQTACQVVVGPGYVLGPYGDEIVIDQTTTFDVCQQSAGQSMGCCGQELDPWCADVRANCSAGTLYLAVRYQECLARPVQTGSCGCGCNDSSCQYSRTRDGFTLGVLDTLPSPYTTPMSLPGLGSSAACTQGPNGPVGRACPPCPSSPWVIIADLTVDGSCNVNGIDCFAHRRYVVSFGNDYELCALASATGDPVTYQVAASPAPPSQAARAAVRLTAPPATPSPAPAPQPAAATPASDPSDTQAAQAALSKLLQPAGLTQLGTTLGNAPALAPALPASTLVAAGSDSTLLAKLGSRTIAAVAATPRDTFVDSMLTSVTSTKRTAVRVWAGALWDAASETTDAVSAAAS
jgi:hypothetical protein